MHNVEIDFWIVLATKLSCITLCVQICLLGFTPCKEQGLLDFIQNAL
jgi:hypothetical protein